MATLPSTINWRVAGRALNAGQLWANLSLPAAGARLLLDSGGTPDAQSNPTALHLGATKAGAKLMAKPKFDNYMVDEFRSPIDTQIGEIEIAIAAELVGVSDMALNDLLSPGFGTRTTDANADQLNFGIKPIAFTSVALIFPSNQSSTKFVVWQLYKALNDAGLEFGVSRKDLAFTPANFRAYEITTRAGNDTLGNFYTQL